MFSYFLFSLSFREYFHSHNVAQRLAVADAGSEVPERRHPLKPKLR